MIVNLKGGLGNQMFQYALGRNLSLKNNDKLFLDISCYKNDALRIYDLDIFENINAEVGDFNINGCIRINEPYFQFCPDILKIENRNIYLDGFWQTYKYFEDINNVIKNDFTFKNKVSGISENIMKKIKETNSILINVRRTDYLNTDFHGVLGNEYIMKGVNIIESKIENPHYFIFSDDIPWCIENIKLDNMTIVDHSHKGDRFDFYFQLMIECKHFIIPNSSFAWWAAWLNNSSDKIVIAPIKWFNAGLNTSDLIPPNWIRI